MLQRSPSRRVGGGDCGDQPKREGHVGGRAVMVRAKPVQSDGGGVRYIAKPVVVDAFRIDQVGPTAAGKLHVHFEEGHSAVADAGMLARMSPKVGDYWVIQEDGYIYLNPAEVFERKYEPVGAGYLRSKKAEEEILNTPLPDRTSPS